MNKNTVQFFLLKKSVIYSSAWLHMWEKDWGRRVGNWVIDGDRQRREEEEEEEEGAEASYAYYPIRRREDAEEWETSQIRQREREAYLSTRQKRKNRGMKKITKHFAQEKKGPFVVKCWLIVLIYFSNVCQCFTVGRNPYPHSHIFSQQFSPSGSVISLLAFLSVSGIAQ